MSWHAPYVFARCSQCGDQFHGSKTDINRAVKRHRHLVEWVAVCGCSQVLVATTSQTLAGLLKDHRGERDELLPLVSDAG